MVFILQFHRILVVNKSRLYISIIIFLLCFSLSNAEVNTFKLSENDSVNFINIKNIKYSPDLEHFIVNQVSYGNRINIFDSKGNVFKSYLIDDSYTDMYLEEIIQLPDSDTILTSNALREYFKDSKNIYDNTISKSVFINDSTLVTIGILNYYRYSESEGTDVFLRSFNTVVLFYTDIYSDRIDVIPLNYITQKLYPQADIIEFANNYLYFTLFPMGLFKNIPNSPEETLAKFKHGENNWVSELELPNEYIVSNVNLSLEYNYRITSYNNETYFISPYTNYIFNTKKDTIWLSDLNDPIKFSLNQNNSNYYVWSNDFNMLDSLSHFIGDVFFKNDKLYALINKPINKDNKIYLNKYTLKGKLIESNVINENQKLETAFYSENKQKLFKVYMENEEWYVEEVDID